MSDIDDKTTQKLVAICHLATSNFPRDTDIRLSVDGEANGSVRVPAYFLLGLIEKSKQQR